MPIERIPDWEKRLARQDAFWEREILDRPAVTMSVPKPNPDYPYPAKKDWKSIRERWFDTEYLVDRALASVMNTDYLGDALPYAWPNLGPEVFSGFFGTELEYGEGTAWSIPNLEDWSEADKLQFSEDNFYWKKLVEMTDALLEAGAGKFYTGITDLHPGGDALTAFRDPAQLNMDLLMEPDAVKAMLDRVTKVFFRVYDRFYEQFKAADLAVATWPGIVSTKKWHVPSNDFSCMISKEMFDEFFLPGIAEECRHMEANIYHLDGPSALRHLDSLLEIPELNAIQWVFGSGQPSAPHWMDVYKKIQAAGKGIQLFVSPDELDPFIEQMKPNGFHIRMGEVKSRDQADAVIRKLEKWR
ncbi:trimethylamine corrinoid protein 2 [bacterium]|nr:trimethylamine corrinoid protein 2 [bacterium]